MRKFDIVKLDWEERFGIAAKGGTAVRRFSSLVMGVMLTAALYGVLALLRELYPGTVTIEMFFPGGAADRSFIPVITVLLAMWTWSMLLLKRSKLAVQKKALAAIPENATGEDLAELYSNVSDFIAPAALEKLLLLKKRNLSELEITGLMESCFDDLEKESENTFMSISSFIWAIPVLGFIGTVLGLARAVSNFGSLTGAEGKSGFDAVLPQITGGLATAFETTLIALVLALILQLISSYRSQCELDFIGEVKKHIMSAAGQTSGTEVGTEPDR